MMDPRRGERPDLAIVHRDAASRRFLKRDTGYRPIARRPCRRPASIRTQTDGAGRDSGCRNAVIPRSVSEFWFRTRKGCMITSSARCRAGENKYGDEHQAPLQAFVGCVNARPVVASILQKHRSLRALSRTNVQAMSETIPAAGNTAARPHPAVSPIRQPRTGPGARGREKCVRRAIPRAPYPEDQLLPGEQDDTDRRSDEYPHPNHCHVILLC